MAAGERLYTLEHFREITASRACDVLQMDLAHCGGLWMGKKIAALAQACDIRVAPHCSIGPVALCAALHFDWSTPNAFIQENFADYDVPWRSELVCGWNLGRGGEFLVPNRPGLGVDLDRAACVQHPYRRHSFAALWESRWLTEFSTGAQPAAKQ
jgi:galactonate dehydratase